MNRHTSFRMALIALLGLAGWLATLLWPVPVFARSSDWHGEYYANRNLSGAPVVVREDDEVDFDWGDESPSGRVPDDNFSARWTRDVHFEEGHYRFKVKADDGVRLWVDGRLIIDRWHDAADGQYSARVKLERGTHTMRLEYYEHRGAAFVELWWDESEIPDAPRGNILTCVRPTDSWIKVYRLDSDHWTDVNPAGWGPLSARGDLKLDGMAVDEGRYGSAGHPYRVELWASGSLVRGVGDTAAGQPEFRVRAGADNPTPWGCPAP